MITSRLKLLLLALLFTTSELTYGQDKPIGYWSSFLAYNNAVGVATDGTTLYVACARGFFTYKPSAQQIDAYSKVEGMSDISMQAIAYDDVTATAVLVYGNGNIDLFKDKTFYNIPDLKIKAIAGAKTVYQAYCSGGYAYLSSALGAIVIDLSAKQIEETFSFYDGSTVVPVRSFMRVHDSVYYAVTERGIYRVNRNNPARQNYQVWRKVSGADTLNKLTSYNGKLYVSARRTVFAFEQDTLRKVYSIRRSTINGLDSGKNGVFISEQHDSTDVSMVKVLNGDVITDSFVSKGRPVQVVQLMDNSTWIADPFNGLLRRMPDNTTSNYAPDGPESVRGFDVYANNGEVIVAHGGHTDVFLGFEDRTGASRYFNGKWRRYNQYLNYDLVNVRDIIAIAKDETNNTLLLGSFLDGLVTIHPDERVEILKDNSIFDTSAAYFASARQLFGLGFDSRKNLWATSMYALHQLYARSPEGTWYKYHLPGVGYGGPLVIDRNDQIWFINSTKGGNGLTVFDANGTLADRSDDRYYHLTTGAGFGNLPSNYVLSLAKDRNNNIWIGTTNGIGIVSRCSSPFTGTAPCDADRPIVQYDQFAGYLFEGNSVSTIAVDGANRKWVGTDAGVWLLSPDASKIIYRFTAENSPLPSNRVQKIAVDDVTGDVYISTEDGLVSYKSTATEGGTENNNVIVYPNPVPAGYSGQIAIKGLVTDGDVRITDVNGQLVYKTKALGGQAVWDGVDYTGHRPQSGVYLIFVTNSDGTQTYSGKMVFLQ